MEMKEAGGGFVALGTSEVRVSPVGVGTNSWGAKGEADPGKKATFEELHA
jgi:aryl-alcohol dehydrogenase-like predicted oxidoreductase